MKYIMNNFFKAISLIAAVCAAAGCGGSAVTETTAGAGTQAETSTVSETTTAAESVSAEVEELEVDHVDEDGTIYYKNPTEWTYEMVYEALTIEGKKVQAPLTFEDFGDKYSLNDATLTYFEDTKHLEAGIIYDEKKFGSILLTDCADINDRYNKELGFIALRDPEMRDVLPDIKVNNIGLGSVKSDVIDALGAPYSEISEIYQDGTLEGVLVYKSDPEQENGTLIVFLYDDKVTTFFMMLNYQ